jgi:hypothetical protein
MALNFDCKLLTGPFSCPPPFPTVSSASTVSGCDALAEGIDSAAIFSMIASDKASRLASLAALSGGSPLSPSRDLRATSDECNAVVCVSLNGVSGGIANIG